MGDSGRVQSGAGPMWDVIKGLGAAAGVAAALATLDLYAEFGFANYLKRMYVEQLMTEAHPVGRARSLGIELYGLSRDDEWCDKHVVFKMTRSESKEMYSKNDPEFYMQQFGKRIHERKFCPEARSAEVYGYSENSGDLLFRGSSSAAVGWNEWNWESM